MYNFFFVFALFGSVFGGDCLVYSCLCMPFVIIFFSIANISRRRLMARSHVNANTYTMQVSKERIWFFSVFLLWIELTDFKAEEEREKCIEKSSYLIEQANNVQNSNNKTMLVGMGRHRSCCFMLVHFFVIFLYSFAHHFSGKNYFIVMVWSIAIDEQNV